MAVSPVALLSGLPMLSVAVGFALYAALAKLGWRYLGLGAIAWIVTVALKSAWAIPVNTPVYNALTTTLPDWGPPVFYVYVGALTGVFEVGLTYLVLRYSRLGRASWSNALAFGIGFGAFEALLLGVGTVAPVVVALVSPSALSASTLQSLADLNNPLQSVASGWERFWAVWVHVLANVLIFYAVAARQSRWFWLAFVYKTGIDAIAAFAQVSGLESLAGLDPLGRLWALEAVVALWGAVGWTMKRRVRDLFLALPDGERPTSPRATPS